MHLRANSGFVFVAGVDKGTCPVCLVLKGNARPLKATLAKIAHVLCCSACSLLQEEKDKPTPFGVLTGASGFFVAGLNSFHMCCVS